MKRRCDLLLPLLLMLAVARLWLMQLPSSFWLDEIATVFVTRLGSNHPTLAGAAPQAWQSIYYYVARGASMMFGSSEIAYRLPSILAMAVTLLLVARLAARLIHPQAGWFAVFACLALKGINYEAADARPYALGMAVAAAGLWFLVRWLDSGGWGDALLFAAFAALLWRVHLLFWPFYVVFALYAVARLVRGDAGVGWVRAGVVFALVGAALVPVLFDALALHREVQAHVSAPLPGVRELVGALKLALVAMAGGGAWLLSRCLGWNRKLQATDHGPRATSYALIVGWWLCQPLCLFTYSWLSGNSVFAPRYLCLSLPGAALAATAVAARFVPAARWKAMSLILGAGALLWLGQWRQLWPPHHNSDWRGAAHKVNELAGAGTAVICPSPFVEAKAPVWRPDYALPGFLYAHLLVYPIRGKALLFPFADSPEANRFAAALCQTTLSRSGRFVVYGWEPQVHFWREWFAARPELAGWRERRVGSFRDVDVVVFEKGDRR
jgi:hypothetical protein